MQFWNHFHLEMLKDDPKHGPQKIRQTYFKDYVWACSNGPFCQKDGLLSSGVVHMGSALQKDVCEQVKGVALCGLALKSVLFSLYWGPVADW